MVRHNFDLSGRTPCIICGALIPPKSVVEHHGKCLPCYRRELVTVACSGCGKPRQIGRAYAESRGFQNTTCKACAALNHRKYNHKAPKKHPKVEKSPIPINGCVLVPAKESRCDAYFDCPNGFCAPLLGIPADQECARVAGLHGFEGWRCQEGSRPGKMSAQQTAEANEYLEAQAFQNNVEMRLTAGWARSRTRGAK